MKKITLVLILKQKTNKKIIPCRDEGELLAKFLEIFRDIDPDILVGWNSDYFDIPYLYYRMCNVLGQDFARAFIPNRICKRNTLV